jgi:hypothetical protein
MTSSPARRAATRDATFAHNWKAEILERPPLIAPSRQFVYPQAVEEIERGALFVQISIASAPAFLATFALGFAEPSLPHGLWSCPNADQLCAVAGGYAFLVDARQPETWQQISYRPVTAIYPALQHRLLIFAGFHSLCAWGVNGLAWETKRLSWEGLRITDVEGDTVAGLGWDLMTDCEVPFTVDICTGQHVGGAAPA